MLNIFFDCEFPLQLYIPYIVMHMNQLTFSSPSTHKCQTAAVVDPGLIKSSEAFCFGPS